MAKLMAHKDFDVDLVNAKGETILHTAVLTNKPQLVNTVIEAGVDINVRDAQGHSAMFYAVSKENQPVIKTLVEKGATFSEQETAELSTRWMNSADDGNMRIMNCLISTG